MLELAHSQATLHAPLQLPPIDAGREPGWDDLDEPHAAVWQAIRHLFPQGAMVDQVDYGCLLVSWRLRDPRTGAKHFAAPVMIRIEQGLLLALWTCDAACRREIADLLAADVSEGLQGYDPLSRIPRCGVIVLGE